jgi:hypothetical protein
MSAARFMFAWKHMCNKTFFATVLLFSVFGLLELLLLPDTSPVAAGVLRLVVAGVFLAYYIYWMRFYYNVYEVSLVKSPVRSGDLDAPIGQLDYAVEIGHRDAFARRARITLGTILKPEYRHYPCAILYPDDIMIVAKNHESYKQIRAALRDNMERRGVRWNNNFSLLEGTCGFLGDRGNFCNIVNAPKVDKSTIMAMAKQ